MRVRAERQMGVPVVLEGLTLKQGWLRSCMPASELIGLAEPEGLELFEELEDADA